MHLQTWKHATISGTELRFFVLQTLDNGLNVIQLETAVGAAIKSFDGALGMLTFMAFLKI